MGRWTTAKILLAALFCAGSAHGLQEYYSLSRSVRALGMGNAFYSLSDDESALFYNPAGLALYRGKPRVMLLNFQATLSSDALSAFSQINDALKGLSDLDSIINQITSLEGKMLHGGAAVFPYFLKEKFAIGLLLGDVKSTNALLGAGLTVELDVAAIVDSGLFIGKAFSLGKNFHMGITAKFLVRAGGRRLFNALDIAQGVSSSATELQGLGGGLDFDLGFTWEIHRPPIGTKMGVSASFNNLLATEFPWFRSVGPPPQLPRMATLGTYVIFKGGKTIDAVIAQLEVAEVNLGGQGNPDLGARTGRLGKHIRMGIELPIRNWLFLRTGFYQGLVTGGIGIHLPFMKLEFATYGEELGQDVDRLSSRRFAVQIAFGYHGRRKSYGRR